MQNFSQNEFNQIAQICGLWDELEKIEKIRIKNYEHMKKEDLIISLLKSKENIAELFNDNNTNLYDNEISDIRRILHRFLKRYIT